MTLESVKKYLFVLFIFSQMLNICAFLEQRYIEESVTDTEYFVGNINFTWRIADYSQIFDTVHTSFNQTHTSTSWELSLKDKTRIFLKRIDIGDPVFAHINFSLITQNGTFQGEKKIKFRGEENIFKVKLINLNVDESQSIQHFIKSDSLYDYIANVNRNAEKIPILFENDILILKIKMKILGPEVSIGHVRRI